MFDKVKIFAYENNDGDHGIICAKSMEKAEKIFHETYPKRNLDSDKSSENSANLFEVGEVKNNQLHCLFPR